MFARQEGLYLQTPTSNTGFPIRLTGQVIIGGSLYVNGTLIAGNPSIEI
jgi:hypothetical protein